MIEPPNLDIDKRLQELYGRTLGTEQRQERRVVANLVHHLDQHGFKPVWVWDGEEETTTETMKEVMEEVFNLDEARVGFAKPGKRARQVLLILGNDPEEIIADWRYGRGDPDGFNAAMEEFDPEEVVA